MKREMEMVREFQELIVNREIVRLTPEDRCTRLIPLGLELLAIAERLQDHIAEDPRVLRMHLMTEELGELCLAMAEGNELEALDALADLTYAVIGSALTMDLPLAEAFDEVHSSNMTKRRQPTDPHSLRVREKGPDYRAPDLERVLREHRDGMYAVRGGDVPLDD